MGIDHLICRFSNAVMLFQKLIIFSYWACFRQMKCTYLTLGQKPSLDQVPLELTTQVVGQASCGCLGIFFCISVQLSGAKLLKSKKWEEHLHIKQEDIVMPLD